MHNSTIITFVKNKYLLSNNLTVLWVLMCQAYVLKTSRYLLCSRHEVKVFCWFTLWWSQKRVLALYKVGSKIDKESIHKLKLSAYNTLKNHSL